jgi:predicted nucleic acid-binding protein
MIWLLDTNVVSELWKPRPNPGAEAWLEENKEDCALSEITFVPFMATLNPFTI